MTQTPDCEACGTTFIAWQLQPDCLLWRCPRCGHVRRDLGLARAQARTPAYGGDPSADRLRLALTYRRIRSTLRTDAPLDVLEIGAGEGALLARFSADGHRATGVDPAAAEGSRGPVLARSVEDMPVADGSVDLVVAVHVLEHLEHLSHALQRIARTLRPGGVLYALTPNASSGGLRVFGAGWWMLEDPTHRQFVSPQSAARLLGDAGFESVSARPVRLDSLGVEGASLARLITRPPGTGVLSTGLGRALAVAAAPLGLAVRGLRPRFSPTLEIIARRPAGTPP